MRTLFEGITELYLKEKGYLCTVKHKRTYGYQQLDNVCE